MHKKTVLRIIILALIIIWMLVVFSFSNQEGEQSSELSEKVTAMFVSEEKVPEVEPFVRKVAHLTEYAFGGMLFLLMFLTYEFSDIKRIVLSLLIGAEYAAIDEMHQVFISERTGNISDVFIDSIGIALGICFVMIIYKIIKQIQEKKKEGVSNK